jgi:hypothetical protein
MELSALVKTNKMTVAELQNKMEKQRTTDEQHIIDMDAEIKRLERESIYNHALAKDTSAKSVTQSKAPVT